MIKFLVSILFTFAAYQLSAQSMSMLIDKVIAKVGDEVIYLSELEEQVAYLKEINKKFKPEDVCGVLDEIMLQSLLVNRAKLDSIVIADSEVEGQLQSRIDRTLGMMNNNVQQFEEYYGKTVNEMKEELREGLKNQLMAQRMQQTILGDVQVTPSEVKEFFKNIPKDSLPYFGSEVELAEIVIFPTVNEAEKAASRAKLEEIRKRITEGGEDFGQVGRSLFSGSRFGKSPGFTGMDEERNLRPGV